MSPGCSSLQVSSGEPCSARKALWAALEALFKGFPQETPSKVLVPFKGLLKREYGGHVRATLSYVFGVFWALGFPLTTLDFWFILAAGLLSGFIKSVTISEPQDDYSGSMAETYHAYYGFLDLIHWQSRIWTLWVTVPKPCQM